MNGNGNGTSETETGAVAGELSPGFEELEEIAEGGGELVVLFGGIAGDGAVEGNQS